MFIYEFPHSVTEFEQFFTIITTCPLINTKQHNNKTNQLHTTELHVHVHVYTVWNLQ